MNTRERGILTGLAIVLAAAIVFILVNRAQEEETDGGGVPAPATSGDWDLSRLPDVGTPLREEITPGGVTVQVLREGRGAPRGKAQAMDVHYVGYLPKSGRIFDRGALKGLVLEQRRVIPGWIEGLEGIRMREKRRLLIPSRMAYGEQRMGPIEPNSDLVFDVEWVELEITDLRVGTGKEATLGAKILVHYRGTLENGTVFDSSYDRKEPIEFQLKRTGLIEGWVRGIPGMKVGGARRLWVPFHMAYNDRPKGKIPAYSNLTFEVELLDVN